MRILKFGGTSMGSAQNFERIVNIITKEIKTSSKIGLVVSACGKTTDKLLLAGTLAQRQDFAYKNILKEIINSHKELIAEAFSPKMAAISISSLETNINNIEHILQGIFHLNEFSNQTYDNLLSYGELISSQLIHNKILESNLTSKWIDSRTIFKTNNEFSRAQVDFDLTNQNIASAFEAKENILVFGGFIASNNKNITTTLGRGGSDYTASIIAAAVSAKQLQIWTDVNGVKTADPRAVKNAYTLPNLSYTEAMELSHFGAKVIYPPTIIPVTKKNIPIEILNTFDPEGESTLITEENTSEKIICGIPNIKKVALITMQGDGMVGIPGYSMRFLNALSKNDISVMMVTQASSEHSISAAVTPENLDESIQALEEEFFFEIQSNRVDPIISERGLSLLAIVGSNMRNHHGIAGKMFSTLGKNAINIIAIAQGSSENNITTVIREVDLNKALNVLHEEFFEEQIKKINLFVAGIGNVGLELLHQIQKQEKYLLEHQQMSIQIAGVANSKKMAFEADGLEIDNIKTSLQKGVNLDLEKFHETAKNMNLRNSIFVDNTANAGVAEIYPYFLKSGMGIVTCNKIACSASYENFKLLKDLSKKYKAPFYYETNVGAGLPIINTLNDLVKSGDRIQGIKAVLSGSLNFIMNNFVPGKKFVDVVKEAQKEGYTEPDPRIDLSGLDVKRKILILLRESGLPFELEGISTNTFLGDEYFDTSLSIDQFLNKLEENSSYFDGIRDEAIAKDEKLKIVASYSDGKASVAVESVNNSSPYYHLDGSDNIVLFYTDRYPEQPLIIKGAGAGAAVTASGVFGDIMRAAKN